MTKRCVRVLILADNKVWQDTLMQTFDARHVQFQIDIADSITDAYKLIHQSSYHIWIIDGDIEAQKGVEILNHCRKSGLSTHVGVFFVATNPTADFVAEVLRGRDGAIDFINKSVFAPDYLYNMIEQTIYRRDLNYLNVNLNLEIVYTAENPTAKDIASKLKLKKFCDEKVYVENSEFRTKFRNQLASEFEDLLCRLYFDADTVKVIPIENGFSSSQVIVTQSRDRKGINNYEIVKFGPIESIELEYRNFQANVQSKLTHRTQVIKSLTRTTHLAGLVYSFISTGDVQLKSFTQYYTEMDYPDIEKVINYIFRDLCHNWYTNLQFAFSKLGDEYKQLTNCTRDLLDMGLYRLQELVSVVGDQLKFVGLNELSLPNPIPAMLDNQVTIGVLKAVNHGDLNSENILIDDKSDAWLIDFRHTNYGHSLKDLAKLDTVIRYQLLESNKASLEERLLLENALNKPELYSEIEQLPFLLDTDNPHIIKAYKTCRTIRLQARIIYASKMIDSMHDYYIALTYFSLNFLRYFDRTKTQHTHALLSASLLVEKIGISWGFDEDGCNQI